MMVAGREAIERAKLKGIDDPNELSRIGSEAAEVVAKEKFMLRQIDEIADATFLSRVNSFKSKLPLWAQGKKVFGYAEVSIKNVSKNDFFAHSAIQDEIASVAGTGISIKPTSSELKPLLVDKNNVVNGSDAWLRDVDAEFKILSEIQTLLGNKYDSVGKVKLFTDLDPCPSCKSVIKQFKSLYPNIDIEVIYKMLKDDI